MKTTKKLSAKKAVKDNTVKVSPRLRQLLIALVVSVLLLVAYLFKDYNPSLQQEADGFTKLKQDFIALHQEFNKIDNGWEYNEGCVGRGGVYESDTPHSCGIDLILLDDEHTDTSKMIKKYTSALDYSKRFSYSKKSETILEVRSMSFPNAQCSMQAGTSSQKGNMRYITVGCSATAHYFHFPRTDR